MNKKKILIIIGISTSLIIGFIPIFILTIPYDRDQQEGEDSLYPGNDNPYYTYFFDYNDGNLPDYAPQYDVDLKNASYYFNLINEAYQLTSEEIDLLEQNKSNDLNRMGTDHIVDAYYN